MGRRRAKPRKGSKAARMHAAKGVGWQLWAVAAGLALILVALGTALVRGTGPYRTEFEGTVLVKEESPRPGGLDPKALRQLTLEQADGSRLTVEVEKRLYDAAEVGHYVRRTRADGIEVRDAEGRAVALPGSEPPAEGD